MIPRRCPKCQRLVEESESHVTVPSVTLWAVPDLDGDGTRGTAPDAAHGVVPAT